MRIIIYDDVDYDDDDNNNDNDDDNVTQTYYLKHAFNFSECYFRHQVLNTIMMGHHIGFGKDFYNISTNTLRKNETVKDVKRKPKIVTCIIQLHSVEYK